MFKESKVEELISSVKKYFPEWAGFKDPRFEFEEVNYKMNAISLAKELLDSASLSELISTNKYDEISNRLERLGHKTNLLFLRYPKSSDLNILYDLTLDKPSYFAAIFDLLHGKGQSPERLRRYIDYVNAKALPNKWTFPTYFLFLTNPDSDFFVKPGIIKWLSDHFDLPKIWSPDPNPDAYKHLLDFVSQIRNILNHYEPRNMVDIQGFLWVASPNDKSSNANQLETAVTLFAEFLENYFSTAEGQIHFSSYEEIRRHAKHNYESIKADYENNLDISDQVILKLLPHPKNPRNIERGAWVHVAPGAFNDIKKALGAKLIKESEWKKVALAIFEFVKTCVEDPSLISAACSTFSDYPYSKGLQTGMLSPIINALRPESFLIINNKSRKVINSLTGKNYGQSLMFYPATNATGVSLIHAITSKVNIPEEAKSHVVDLFDMFTHWLSSIRNHELDIAPPFIELFNDYSAAEWVFGLMHEAAMILHMNSPTDKLFSFTFRKTAGKYHLHFNYGAWLILGFVGIDGTLSELEIALFKNSLQFEESAEFPFHQPQDEQPVCLYSFPIDAAKEFSEELKSAYEASFKFIYEKFHHWKASRYHDHSIAGIAKAVYKPNILKELLRTGLPSSPDHISHEIEYDFNPSCPFSNETFHLLESIHVNPTRVHYINRKADFVEHVEDPFQSLFREVASRLSPVLLEQLETERNLFSRFLKNDWGKGGAWDYYWGAFYPKSGKRTEDTQLFLWINHEKIKFGYYLSSHNSSQKELFLQNCLKYQSNLTTVLEDSLSDERFEFGIEETTPGKLLDKKNKLNWRDWLVDPEKRGIRVSVELYQSKVLTMSTDELSVSIVNTFERLFPLFLLSQSTDPMPHIDDYLNSLEDIEPNQPFELDDLANETGFTLEELTRWIAAIYRKQQVVIYGPPGTGKTYLAKKLARHLISGGTGAIETVQFHSAYAYEDFIQGIRPKARPDGTLDYSLVPGRFLDFCRQAQSRKDPCVLIIDEINRADLARVFGELMYLLEYRNSSVNLAGGTQLRIPENVYIIGTMNTADRSIALVDHALRRRFAFLALYPNYEILRRFHRKHQTEYPVENLIRVLEDLNHQIGDRHYHVGVSFFLKKDLPATIEDIWRMEIEPYLEEYFFDQPDKVTRSRWESIVSRLSS